MAAQEVPQGTIGDVLAWVNDDPQRAQQALDAERAGQNRSTLITQLEATVSSEPAQPDPTAPADDEALAEQEELAPEQPADVALYPADSGVVFHSTQVRDPDVEVPEDAGFAPAPPEPAEDEDEPEPIDGEQVEYIDAASSTNALALAFNGTTYLLGAQSVGQLKQIVDKTVVGLAL